MTIKKAVFPVAGFGTRFLPATKVVAKEMLPVFNQPLIYYAVQEAVAAGCKELIFVTNRYKHDIADFFDTSYELESRLEASGKHELLSQIRTLIPDDVKVAFVTQSQSKGLGHAILCAEHVVGENPFYVILPDDLMWFAGIPNPTLSELNTEAWRANGAIANLATMTVPMHEASAYGIVSYDYSREGVVNAIVEKPKMPPSNNAVIGRYLFSHRIFDYLRTTEPGAGGEIQLTDAISAAIAAGELVQASGIRGQRFDCGTPLGMFKAQTVIGMHYLGDEATEYLKKIPGL